MMRTANESSVTTVALTIRSTGMRAQMPVIERSGRARTAITTMAMALTAPMAMPFATEVAAARPVSEPAATRNDGVRTSSPMRAFCSRTHVLIESH